MPAETIEDTDEYTVSLDDERGIPVFTYETFLSGEEFRAVANRWEEIVAEQGAERYVVNTQAITAHDDEDKQWLAETWIPKLIDHGVRAGAGVFADSVIANMDMEQIESQLNAIDPGFEYRIFGSEADALAWLSDQ